MEDVTNELLLEELMALGGCGVHDRYQRETESSLHCELLPVAISFLRRIAKGGRWLRSPMQFQDALVDTTALAETLLKILKDIEDRMDSIAKKTTPVMAACGSYLFERRHEVYYWLDRTGETALNACCSLAELIRTSARKRYEQSREVQNAKRFRGVPLLEQPDALADLDSVITRAAENLLEVLEKEPAVLFEPGSRIPLVAINSLSPGDFELLVAALLERDGFTVERAAGRSGDNAADCIAVGPMGLRYAVQVKHTKTRRNIGPDPARLLVATLREFHKADIALVVTNGGFTKAALTEAPKIRALLVDQYRLERWAEHGESLVDVLSR
ncbi:restriction endonuclease [Streptomyces sp. SP17BM10]|uniref:restriction endonuclease n=1 Tax=Streptomyces sp. SP17BM10 TaxID=3002530 RepID=UPI002E76CAFC|nr:restriction endonuclease [Streptomyces sp. SP17BM10]MEE1782567.1 restriction endonuclease [Streptomyces sp. SP17BM10]